MNNVDIFVSSLSAKGKPLINVQSSFAGKLRRINVQRLISNVKVSEQRGSLAVLGPQQRSSNQRHNGEGRKDGSPPTACGDLRYASRICAALRKAGTGLDPRQKTNGATSGDLRYASIDKIWEKM
jgi:hypothetical protein